METETAFWFFVAWLGTMTITTIIGTWIMKRYRDSYGYAALLSILTALLLINTVMAGRRVTGNLFGWDMILLSGTVIWPFTSQVVDMINEVYGERKSYVAAAVAYLGRVILIAVVFFAGLLAPMWEPAQEQWWQGYFGSLGRVVLAGAISYGLVQLLNISVFARFKRKTLPNETTIKRKIIDGFKRSWGGDIVGDIIDSPVFYTIAFAGVIPWPQLWTLIVSATAVKMVINQVDLPFYILFRVILGDKIQKDY